MSASQSAMTEFPSAVLPVPNVMFLLTSTTTPGSLAELKELGH
jgi:hypothetical protein